MDLRGCWLVEVDIRKFFDTLDHAHLRAFLQQRVRDGVLTRLIGKWLQAQHLSRVWVKRHMTHTLKLFHRSVPH